MSLTATNAQVYKGTAAVTYGSGSGVSGRQLQGTATITYGGAPTSNTALSLPGTSGNYMNLGSTHPAHFDTTTSNLFVEAWFNAPSYPGNVDFIFVITGSTTSTEDVGLWVSGIYGVNWRLWNTLGNQFTAPTGSTLNTNQWYHVAGSWNYSTKTLYSFLNGVLLGSITLTGTARYSSSSQVQIGAANNSGAGNYFPFNGYIQDIRVVQGGTVPTTSFTPASAPFRLNAPPYVSGGTTVLSLYEQYFYPSWLSLPGPTGNYMNLGTTHPAHFDTASSNLFVEAWFYSPGPGGGGDGRIQHIIAVSGPTVTSTEVWGLFFYQGNYADFYMYNTVNTAYEARNSTALQYNTWYHLAGSWDSVNKKTYVFVNGSVGATVGNLLSTTPRAFDSSHTLQIGTDFLTGNTAKGYIQDVRVTQGGLVPTTSFTPVTAPFGLASPSYVSGGTTVLSLATQYFQTGLTTKTLFNQISSAASASAKGIYSLYAVNGASPLVINVRNGTTAATSDFYGDIYGNLTTSAGQSISSWLGAATGYITTWYDQSGLGNHAAQSTNALQPTITLGTPNLINFGGTGYFTIANQVMPIGNGVFTTITKLGTHPTASQTYFWNFGTTSSGACVGFDLRTDFSPNRYEEFFYGTGDVQGPTYTANATVSGVYNQSSHTLYLNGTQVGTSAVSSRNGASGNQTIGAIIWAPADGRGTTLYTGTMRDMYVFSTALSTADRNIMENGYTGTKAQFTTRPVLPAVLVNPGTQSFTLGQALTISQTALEPANSITWSLAPTGNGLSISSSSDYTLSLSAPTAVAQNRFTVSATNKNGLTTIMQFTGSTPSLSKVTAVPIAVYSLRGQKSTYTLAFNVRNGTTNATQDFYADTLGNLTTGAGSGQTLTQWLGAATGYITTWYDQSGNGNHASQGTTAYQPVITSALIASNIFGLNFQNSCGLTTAAFTNSINVTLVMVIVIKNTIATWGNFAHHGHHDYDWSIRQNGLSPTYIHWHTNNDNTGDQLAIIYDTPMVLYCTMTNGTAMSFQMLTSTSSYVTSATETSTITVGSKIMYIGKSDTNEACNSYIGEFNYFQSVLSATDQTAILADVCSRWGITNFNPLFQTTSSTVRSAVLSAYSLRDLYGTSPVVVNVRRSSDNLTQDFYADTRGNLTTLSGGAGQTLASWLGGATGYVTIWYDQSGLGNHASQGTSANQPVIQSGTKGPGYMLSFTATQNQYLTGFAYSKLANTKYTVCEVDRRTASISPVTNGVDNAIISCGTNQTTYQLLHITYRSGTTVYYGQFFDDTSATVSAFTTAATEPVRFRFHMASSTASGRRIYVYGDPLGYVTSFDTTKTTLLSASGVGNFYIGYYVNGPTYYQGELYETIVFNNSLYDLDNTTKQIATIYDSQYDYINTPK